MLHHAKLVGLRRSLTFGLIFPSPVNPLSFLRNQPQFQQMRQLIQQNASLLPALLQEIGRENPELLQVKQRAGILIAPLLRNKRA